MIDVAQVYGPDGPDAGGDDYVAEVLTRTVEGQTAALRTFDMRMQTLAQNPYSINTELSSMVAVHSEWLSMMYWQMATCFADGTIARLATIGGEFSHVGYPTADSLCDRGSEWSRKSARIRSLIEQSSKVRITQLQELPDLSVTPDTINGVWMAYDFVVYQVGRDAHLFASSSCSPRFAAIYEDALKQVTVHTSVMNELRKDFYATKIAQNGIDLLRAAHEHVEALFELGQKLWAPFLHGPVYSAALRRQLGLDELNLGFDPWIITDPQLRRRFEGTADEKYLVEFWSGVGEPRKLEQLAQEVLALKQRDAIRRRYDRGYNTPPWPSQYIVRQPVTIGGRTFVSGDLITFFIRTLSANNVLVDVRKTGHLVKPLDLLGHPAAE